MELTILQCTSCGKVYVPNKYTCPSCLSNDLVEVSIPGIGRIYSFTTVSIAPQAFANDVPYDVILVELKNGIRVTARLLEGKAKIEEKVKLVGYEDSVYWFKPLDEEVKIDSN